jgi:hypothetical protein
MIIVVVGLISLIILAVVIGIVVMGARRPVPVESGADDFEDGIVSEPVPIASSTSARAASDYRADDVLIVHHDEIEREVPAVDEPAVRWTKQFEPQSGALSDETRLRLINDLGMLGASWCIPLLMQAYDQETDPAFRVSAQLALRRCQEREAIR